VTLFEVVPHMPRSTVNINAQPRARQMCTSKPAIMQQHRQLSRPMYTKAAMSTSRRLLECWHHHGTA